MNKTNITILEISDKGKQVKVKGQGQDGTHTYSVFKTKQDGSPTQAYSLLQSKGVGQQICFGWEEYHGTMRDGKPYVSRSVKMAQEAGTPDYVPNVEQPARTQPRASQSLTKETDWDKIAEGKVRNSVAVAFIGQCRKFDPSTVNEMNKWVGWIMTGELFNKPEETKYNPSGDWQDEELPLEEPPF